MSLEEAYANAVISDALDTDDEAEVCLFIYFFMFMFIYLSTFIYFQAEEPKKSDLNAEPAAEVEEKKDV